MLKKSVKNRINAEVYEDNTDLLQKKKTFGVVPIGKSSEHFTVAFINLFTRDLTSVEKFSVNVRQVTLSHAIKTKAKAYWVVLVVFGIAVFILSYLTSTQPKEDSSTSSYIPVDQNE